MSHYILGHVPVPGTGTNPSRKSAGTPPKSPDWVRPMRWPPQLHPVVHQFEGLPARIGVVQLIGRLRGFEAYLWVFYGRPRPTVRQVQLARAELGGARLP